MKKAAVWSLASLLALALLLFLSAFLWAYQQLHKPLALKEPRVYEVPRGQTFIHLLDEFKDQGWIASTLPMRIWLRLQATQAPIHAGEYRLESPLTLPELYRLLQSGEVVHYPLTIPEGWTFKQLRQELLNASKLEPVTAQWSEAEIMAAVGQPEMPAEGWFFPDTYHYHKGMQDLELLRLAHRRMQQELDTAWAEREPDLPLKTPYEALILASIVERETGAAHERPSIAGVFIRRLQKGMRLQTDPTVIYGMGEAYEGRITRADLRRPTPWNTYTIAGLPPTPIALPGSEALHASVKPAEGDTLYFVARGDGTHYFSVTLDEHNRAVNRYQRNRREDYRSSPIRKPKEPDSE